MKSLLAEIPDEQWDELFQPARSIWRELPIQELRELAAFHSFKALQMVKEAGLDVPEAKHADRTM